MDKKAFEREAKQRMAFQLYTLQEFWRNLGLKNIPPGTLNGIISQTKAELNADWLSVTPQSLRDMVVRHRRLVLKSKSQLKDVQQPNKTDSDTVKTENHKESTTEISAIREDAKTVEPVTDKLDPPSSETGALTTEEPTLPERETTIRAKLQKCLEVLNETPTMKGTPAYLPTSKLAKKLQKISDFMMGVVQSKGEHGSKLGKPAALHVCGGPGAGKTMGVTDCKRQMIAWAKDNLEAWQEMPVFCHIHGSSFQHHCTSKSAAMKALRAGISNEIGKAFDEDRMLKRSKSDEKKTAVILIIDEIDFLVSEWLVGDRLVSSEDFLQTVLKWANDDQMAFALIGISNSVANARGRRLHELGQVSHCCSTFSFCSCTIATTSSPMSLVRGQSGV
jgi:Cdc6-like AAA superfamily ATPase